MSSLRSATGQDAAASPFVEPSAEELHASLIEIFNANTTSVSAGNATCFDFDGIAAADAILQLLGYPAVERPRREPAQPTDDDLPF